MTNSTITGILLFLTDSGMRLKCKYDAYLELHRKKSTPVSDVSVWEAASTGSMDALLASVPDESYAQITAVHDRLIAEYKGTLARVEGILNTLTTEQWRSRKKAAAVFRVTGELSGVLFVAYVSNEFREDPAVQERIWQLLKPPVATTITHLAI